MIKGKSCIPAEAKALLCEGAVYERMFDAASCSLQVDAVSLMMAVGIYLRLGFASGHAYAYKVPVTFGLTLCFLLSLLAGVLCLQDR